MEDREREFAGARGDWAEDAYRRITSDFSANLCLSRVQDGQVVAKWVSCGLAELCGYEPEEIEAHPDFWQGIIHPADRDRVIASTQRLLTGSILSEHYRIFRKDGQLRWVRDISAPGYGSRGEVVRTMQVLVDVTEAESVADDLIAIGRLLDEAVTPATIRDPQGRVIYCNEAAAHLYGRVTAAQMLGTTLDDVLLPEARDEFYRNVFPKLNEQPWTGELVVKRASGEPVDISVSTSPFRRSDGQPAGVYTVFDDISQLKRAENALKRSEAFAMSIRDSLSAHICVIDRDGLIVAVNRAWEGFAVANGDPSLAHTGVGVSYLDVCRRATGEWSEGADAVLGGLESVLAGRITEFEFEYPCPSRGVDAWYFMRAAPLVGDRGGSVISHINITDRKRAEEALRQNEEFLRSLTDNVDAVIFRMTPDRRPVKILGRTDTVLGHSLDDLSSDAKLWIDVVHPDDQEILNQQLREIASTGVPGHVEVRLVDSAGQVRWLRKHLTPRYDEAGGLMHFDGVIVDISERVRAQQREAEHAMRMEVLTEIGQAFASSLDFDAVLDSVVQRIGRVVESVCAVVIVDVFTGRLARVSACCGDDEAVTRLDRVLREAAPTLEKRLNEVRGRLRTVLDLRDISPEAAALADAAGLGPSIVVPVSSGSDVLCILGCSCVDGTRDFDEEDLWFLTEVSAHASSALTNAQLYRRQSRIAETLQRSLIPAKPELDYLEIATSYVPALGETEVGGDFFDIIDYGEHVVGIVVGDVSGKGMEAAVHTAEAKYMLRAFAHADRSPGSVVTALNNALCSYTGDFTFITLFYCVIDADRQSLVYVNAGHETPLVICTNEHAMWELEANGPVLGVISGYDYEAGSLRFEADDILLCYTDGITDVPSDHGRFGFDRLRETVFSSGAGTPQDMLDHIMHVVQEFGSGRQPDDQVVVVVRPRPTATSA